MSQSVSEVVNPEAYQLHLVLGFNYLRQTREMEGDLFDPTPEQKEVLAKCQASCHAAAEFAIEQAVPFLTATPKPGSSEPQPRL